MNLTILALTCSHFYYHSPAFVNNDLVLINSHLKQFSSTLFFNQQSLLLKNTEFSKGLGGIVYNEYDGSMNNENHLNETFDGKPITIDSELKRSISIIGCKFLNIQDKNTIFVDRDSISIYITSSIFISCRAVQNGVVLLQRARCLTMTHVCTYDCGCHTESGFLNYDCRDIDFSYCLYNTFTKSTTGDYENSFNIFVRSGSQFYRCNNLTETTKGGFHFNAPECFSFSMTTVKCNGSCFQLSGYASDKKVLDKTIDMVNFLTNNEYLLKLSGESPFKLTIINSVLLSSHNDAKLFRKETYFKIAIEIKNCIVLDKYKNDDGFLSFTDCTNVAYDITYLMIMPHYTYDNVCVGQNVEKSLSAHDCNAGNCIDSLCNRTISFPDDVVPYTTIPHFDLQTDIFTPSAKFSKSDEFSKTSEFSDSLKFSKSDYLSSFKDTIITNTNEISTNTNEISTNTNEISSLDDKPSLKFTGSEFFSQSETAFNINGGGNQDKSSKGSNKAMIGAIAGVAAAVIVAVVIVAVFLIRKHKRLNLTSDIDMMETNDSGTTTNNVLKGVMEQDDPFAEEFTGDNPANGGIVI